MYQVHVVCSGLAGSPAYMTFNFGVMSGKSGANQGEADNVAGQVQAFLTTLLPWSDNDARYQVSPDVSVIDPFDGEQYDAFTVSEPILSGTVTDAELPPQNQALLALGSGSYKRGRRIQGRIYLPAQTVKSITADGTVNTVFQSQVNASAVTNLLTPPGEQQLAVWSRPRTTGGPIPVVIPGDSVEVISAVLRPTFAFLGSRRL